MEFSLINQSFTRKKKEELHPASPTVIRAVTNKRTLLAYVDSLTAVLWTGSPRDFLAIPRE